MGKKAPKAPDPYQTAAAQTQSNKETAIANAELNRINQYTPYGSLTYNVKGKNPDGTPIYEQHVNLTPEQQAIFNSQVGQEGQINDIASGYMGRIAGQMGRGIDTSGLSPIQGAITNDFSGDRLRVESALRNRMEPEFRRQEDDLRNRLANQGIMNGSEAWNREMDTLNRARNDAEGGIVQAGGQEQSRLMGLALQNANFNNTARQQGLQEANFLRQLPLNEFNALRSSSQVQNPTFGSTYPVAQQGVNIADLINQNYQSQLASYNNSMSGLFGLGGALGSAGIMALAPSDRRLKRDIERVGTTPGGLGVYTFKYLASETPQIGVMADEVAAIYPDAIVANPSGYALVDYGRIG